MRCSVYFLWLAALLPAAAATTPVFQFSESWIDQVKAVRDPCDTPPCPVYYDVVPSNPMSFKVTIPWPGVDPNSLDWDTAVSLRLGDWQFQRILGEAGNFQPGVSNVTFVETGEDSAGRVITLSRVFVKWTASSLVVTGYDKMLVTSIVAGNHLQTNASIREWLPAEVTFGGFTYARNLFTTGKASTRFATIGTGDAQYQDYLSTVTVSGSADFSRPTARISYPVVTYPSTGVRWFSNNIAIRGTATDNSGVTAVFVRVNNEEFQTATGTNAWTNIVALAPGTNVIQVKAIDADTNESALVSTRVIFVVTNSLTLAINPPGSGRVTGVAHGQSLEVGRRVSRHSHAARHANLFAGWTGDWPGSNPTLAFFMQSNMTLTANFAPNPFLSRVATYRGLFLPEYGGDVSRTNAGSVVITLGQQRQFLRHDHTRQRQPHVHWNLRSVRRGHGAGEAPWHQAADRESATRCAWHGRCSRHRQRRCLDLALTRGTNRRQASRGATTSPSPAPPLHQPRLPTPAGARSTWRPVAPLPARFHWPMRHGSRWRVR